jgi:hypothetical protein
MRKGHPIILIRIAFIRLQDSSDTTESQNERFLGLGCKKIGFYVQYLESRLKGELITVPVSQRNGKEWY